MTSSGYPRIVKEWKRGTPLARPRRCTKARPNDMYIAAGHDHTPGFERDFVSRTIAFYNDELYLRGADGKLAQDRCAEFGAKVGARRLADAGTARALRSRRQDVRRPAALLATRFDEFMAGERDFKVLFAPTDSTSLAGFSLDPRPSRAERDAKTSRTG